LRLKRSVVTGPGIARRRRGKGFSYTGPDGEKVDAETLQRIDGLVIPPAWKKVWISPHANGHIQAVGTDVAGRKQYLYHLAWQEERAEEKFDRVLELSTRLPEWRRHMASDLAGRGYTRERVLALALHLIDRGYFRAGGDQSAEEFEHYGLSTLLCEHVSVRKDTVQFDFPAKSGVRRVLEIDDPEIVKAVRSLRRRQCDSDRFLVHRKGTEWSDVHAADLNARFKEMVGDEYTVKDLRTWHGTVLAAEAFVDADPPVDPKVIKRVVSHVMKEVSGALGNTPAVARSSYVDPRVVRAYEEGHTITAAKARADRKRNPRDAQAVVEKATRALVRRFSD
jgi:DNA topoisomerase-1